MSPELSRQRMLILGVIAMLALLLGVIGLFAIGDRQELWHRQARLMISLPSAGGLDVGARVRVQGINAGQVDELIQPEQRGGNVLVRIRINRHFLASLGRDARAEVLTEGLIGGKTLEISPGTSAEPFAADAVMPGRADNLMADLRVLAQKSQGVLDELHGISRQTRQISERGEKLLDDLSQLSAVTKTAVGEIGALTKDVREGQGPLGREVVATLRQLQQTGSSITQSIESLKQMPLLGKYLDNTTKLLVRPNYMRSSVQFKEEDLFPPGRALFTPEGLIRLNQWAETQLPKINNKSAEIVIVAYQGTATDPQAADILTQRQAEAVRTYLIDQYKIDKLGWLTSRMVHAIGMGVRSAPGEPPPSPPPPNRVEIIVFVSPGA